ncbi:hypothetical protein AAFF_G00028520 [Aldrovandia affinis]|uniref:Uncharacterized protein n=1 Tax=Aldrovandia affinis TaxID=143900 RepID=A0AAD7WGJ5_9TELE|nr:hypothetical protein AAFF_G00028520 [Aldrovandia affinis]
MSYWNPCRLSDQRIKGPGGHDGCPESASPVMPGCGAVVTVAMPLANPRPLCQDGAVPTVTDDNHSLISKATSLPSQKIPRCHRARSAALYPSAGSATAHNTYPSCACQLRQTASAPCLLPPRQTSAPSQTSSNPEPSVSP